MSNAIKHLLYNGDDRGWRTAIHAALELSEQGWGDQPTKEELEFLAMVDVEGPSFESDEFDWQEICSDFIRDTAHKDSMGFEWKLEEYEGSIWKVLVDVPSDWALLELPSSWASYLVNDDESSLDEEEFEHKQEIDEIVNGHVVDVSDESDFTRWHDAYHGLACDCSTYLIDRRKNEKTSS